MSNELESVLAARQSFTVDSELRDSSETHPGEHRVVLVQQGGEVLGCYFTVTGRDISQGVDLT